jgi:hypothetical protein
MSMETVPNAYRQPWSDSRGRFIAKVTYDNLDFCNKLHSHELPALCQHRQQLNQNCYHPNRGIIFFLQECGHHLPLCTLGSSMACVRPAYEPDMGRIRLSDLVHPVIIVRHVSHFRALEDGHELKSTTRELSGLHRFLV